MIFVKFIKKYATLWLVLIIAFILFNSATVSTYSNEYKVVRQFGEVVKIIDTPGWSFKIPFIQSTQSIPKYKMCYDIAPSSITTSDKKVMLADCFVIWEITDPLAYITTLGANKATAESRIDAVVYSSLKTVLSSLKQDEIIDGRDGEVATSLTEYVGDSLDACGINVKNIETKMLDLPNENKEAVFERMISERNNIAAGYTAQGDSEYKKIKNDTDKKVSIMKSQAEAQAAEIVAEGEAEYMRILSEAYNDSEKADFYNYVRSLDSIKETLKGNNKTIILDEESELARILRGVE